MAFKDFPDQKQGVELLQRSLARSRLSPAHLFTAHQLASLEALARTLAKALTGECPARANSRGPAIDCCDQCLNCRKIDAETHADVHWVRPESKSRVITIDQMRDLMQEVHLKPNEAEYKFAVLVASDRLKIGRAHV